MESATEFKEEETSRSSSEVSTIPIKPRQRHVAFAPSIEDDDDQKEDNTEYVEDNYYVDGPGNEPILYRADDVPRHNQLNQTHLSARKKSMQMMSEYLTENEGILKAVPGESSLFGPRLAVDPKAVRRKVFNQKRPSIFQHVARIHHKFGIRHYVLIGLLAIYSALGGLIFLKLESENEIKNLEQTRHQIIKMIEELSQDVFDIANVTVSPESREDVILLVQEYYREMLKVEGKYSGSVYHKYERINMRLTWYYSSAVFFAMTLFTTIGYGTIAAQTVAGKIFTIIYATIGIPLMLVVLSDIGRVLLRFFTKAYNIFRKGVRFIVRHFYTFILRKKYDSIYEDKEFPILLSIPIVVGYLILCSIIVTAFDYHDGLTPGLSTGDAMYFSFISMSTIGLGDVMPNNIEYSPVLAVMFLFGLALLSVVNSTFYEKMERKFLYTVDKLEAWLENIHYYRHGREGYNTFKALGPNIQLLALALPIFDDDEENHIEKSLETGNTELGKKVFTRPRTRTNSLIEEKIDAFRPVLGILGGINVGGNRRRAHTADVYTPSTIPTTSTSTTISSAPAPNESQMEPPSPPGSRIRRVQSDQPETGQEIIQPEKFRLRTISELV
ncbi:hypothetical protein FO519_000934 [Halicephalobus sp. NKZ332]|nr:hypothetical protein FO519_000934 [Halicephalobus sp. NKZ332]